MRRCGPPLRGVCVPDDEVSIAWLESIASGYGLDSDLVCYCSVTSCLISRLEFVEFLMPGSNSSWISRTIKSGSCFASARIDCSFVKLDEWEACLISLHGGYGCTGWIAWKRSWPLMMSDASTPKQ